MTETAPTFEEAWEKYRKRVWNICMRMVNDQDAADDLTQDVFIQLWKKIHTFRGESKFSTWLHRMAVNTVLMKLRRGKKLKMESLDAIQEDYAESGTGAYQEAILSEDSELRSSAARADLMKALDQLPPGYRTALVLHDIEGMEHHEVSELMGTSIGCSKSQLAKAREALASVLGAPVPAREVEAEDWDGLFGELERLAAEEVLLLKE